MFIIIIIIIIIIIVMLCHVTGLFSLALLLNQWQSPLLRLPVSDRSTLLIMCDVHSIAVFCSKSIACLPGVASKCFFKPFVTILVAPVITSTIIRFMLPHPLYLYA